MTGLAAKQSGRDSVDFKSPADAVHAIFVKDTGKIGTCTQNSTKCTPKAKSEKCPSLLKRDYINIPLLAQKNIYIKNINNFNYLRKKFINTKLGIKDIDFMDIGVFLCASEGERSDHSSNFSCSSLGNFSSLNSNSIVVGVEEGGSVASPHNSFCATLREVR